MPTIQLHLGDCLDVLRTLPDSSVDAVVTDPPYGMNWNTNTKRFSGGSEETKYKRSAGRDDKPRIIGDNQPFDPSPWLRFKKVVLWGANHFAGKLPVGTTLVWIKRTDHAFGTFLSDAEIAWSKGGHGVYLHRDLSMYATARQREHPTQKPVALMAWCIERLKLPAGSTILDPYMGSGSTGVAAAQLGYNFIGIEREPEYYAIAERRINEAIAARESDLLAASA